MADIISKAKRSHVMAQVRSKNTRPEIITRRAIHAAGFRFRLHQKSLPGSPDIVLSRYKTVVFVNGCFWHWHGCKASRMPSTNRPYWESKINRNVERDRTTYVALEAEGWSIRTVWECELSREVGELVRHLEQRRLGSEQAFSR